MTDTWTWATVTQATPLRIKVDGDTSELDATTDNLVGSLAVDDRVRVHLHSDGIIVTGLQGGNDKVYMIDHPESDQPGAYPEGITVSDTNVGVGWPSSYATAVTTAVSTSRISQVVYEKDGAERQWWRTGTGTTWTAWKETAGYESDGRLKAADGVAADDVATVGQVPVGDTGWVDITINSGFAYTKYSERPRVRKMNGVIYLIGVFDDVGMSANSTYTVGQLPSWAYPEINIPMAAGGSDGAKTATFFVVSDGRLQIRVGSNLGSYYGIGGHSWPAI